MAMWKLCLIWLFLISIKNCVKCSSLIRIARESRQTEGSPPGSVSISMEHHPHSPTRIQSQSVKELQTFKRDDVIIISCICKMSARDDKLYLFLNGELIREVVTFSTWIYEKLEFILNLKYPENYDNTEVKCVAKNKFGTSQNHTRLNVKYAPTVDLISVNNSSINKISIVPGESLTCTAKGNPKPIIRWIAPKTEFDSTESLNTIICKNVTVEKKTVPIVCQATQKGRNTHVLQKVFFVTNRGIQLSVKRAGNPMQVLFVFLTCLPISLFFLAFCVYCQLLRRRMQLNSKKPPIEESEKQQMKSSNQKNNEEGMILENEAEIEEMILESMHVEKMLDEAEFEKVQLEKIQVEAELEKVQLEKMKLETELEKVKLENNELEKTKVKLKNKELEKMKLETELEKVKLEKKELEKTELENKELEM